MATRAAAMPRSAQATRSFGPPLRPIQPLALTFVARRGLEVLRAQLAGLELPDHAEIVAKTLAHLKRAAQSRVHRREMGRRCWRFCPVARRSR